MASHVKERKETFVVVIRKNLKIVFLFIFVILVVFYLLHLDPISETEENNMTKGRSNGDDLLTNLLIVFFYFYARENVLRKLEIEERKF